MAKKRSGFSAISAKLRAKTRGKGKEAALFCILSATAAGILTLFLLLCLFAALLAAIPLPLSVFPMAGLLLGALAAFGSGFVCALLSGERGFFYGLGCGALLFVILLVISTISWKQGVDSWSLIKFFTMLLCGAIGGSVGVNR